MSLRQVLLAGAVLALAGCTPSGQHTAPGASAKHCSAPAPTTAAGYATLFGLLPTREWAAGDDGITVPFGRRSIWLFGDTFSARPRGFVHSTAIVQTGGCLHVSHAGDQVLPDDADTSAQVAGHTAVIHHIYWIETGHPIDATHMAITARAMRLVPHWDANQHKLVYGQWDFHDGGFDRTALVSVSTVRDLTFVRWTAEAHTPPPNPGSMLNCDAPAPAQPGHFCYARHVHPELRLSAGQVLVTTSQGWDDGRLHPFGDYRLIFTATPYTERRTTESSTRR